MELPEPIEAERMRLRTLKPEDADGDYPSWVHDEEVTRFLEIRHNPPDRESCRDFIGVCRDAPNTLFLGMFLKDASQAHIGNIKLEVIPRDYRGEIGLVIGVKEAWGKGYATEAIAALSSYAFDELKLHRLHAGCYASNVGSERAFLRAGFEREGVLKQHRWMETCWEDEILLGRINESSSGSQS